MIVIALAHHTHPGQCDIIYAADDATFGLPELKIGTIPGAGGTQRLARALGKHKVRSCILPKTLVNILTQIHPRQAMEFILTGDSASGAEFERLGVVNKVFPKQEVVPAAMKLAEKIAAMSGPAVTAAKQAVLTGTPPRVP